MGIFDRVLRDRKQSRKRRFNVRRGTGAQLARDLKLSEGHVSQVINGKREPSPTLLDALQRAELSFRNGID